MLDLASQLMEVSARDLDIDRGRGGARRPRQRDSGRARSPGRPRAGDRGADADLEVEATFDGGEGGWSGGTHCAIVEVDVETGVVRSSGTSWPRTAAR